MAPESRTPRLTTLGGVAATGAGSSIALAGRLEARLVRRLVMGGGALVAEVECIDAIWGEDPPLQVEHALTVLLGRVRARVAEVGMDGRLTRGSSAIGIDLDGIASDWAEVHAAWGAACRARATGDPSAGRWAAEGLRVWHPRPFGDDDFGCWAAAAARLAEIGSAFALDLLVAVVQGHPDIDPTEALAAVARVAPEPSGNEALETLLLLVQTRAGDGARARHRADRAIALIRARGIEPTTALLGLADHLDGGGSLDDDLIAALRGQALRSSGVVVGAGEVTVGRVAALRTLVRPATVGAPEHPVLVTGVTGMGRSHLLREADSQLRVAGWRVLRPGTSGDAPGLGLVDESGEPWQPEAVAALTVRGRPPVLGRSLALLAAPHPVAVLIDDAGALDASARADLAELVIERQRGIRLVVAVRHDELEPLVRALAHTAVTFDHLELAPLARPDAAALCAQVRPDLSAPVVELVVSLSGGRPSMILTLAAEVPPASSAGPSRSAPATPERPPPELLGALSRAVLEAADPIERATLELLALATSPVATVVVRRALQPDVDRARTDRAIASLRSGGLVADAAPGVADEIGLADARLGVGIAATMTPYRRAYWHQRMALALGHDQRPGAPVAPDLAHHHREAARLGAPTVASVELLVSAAVQRLREPGASPDAEDLRFCVQLLEGRTVEGASEPYALLGRALVGLAEAEERSGHPTEADAAITRAVDIARRHGLSELLADAATRFGGSPWAGRRRHNPQAEALLVEARHALPADAHIARSRVAAGLAYRALARAEVDGSVALAQTSLREAERSADVSASAAALAGVLDLRAPHRDPTAHRALAARLVAIARMLGDRELEATGLFHEASATLTAGHDPGLRRVRALVARMGPERQAAAPAQPLLAFLDGDLEGAQALVEEQIAREAADPLGGDLRAALAAQLAEVHRCSGRSSVLAPLVEGIDAGRLRGAARIGVGRLLLDVGRVDEVRSLVDAAIETFDATVAAAPVAELVLLADLTAIVAAVGEPVAVAEVQARLAPYAGQACSAWLHAFGGVVDHHLAVLALKLDELAAAAELADRAHTQHVELGALPWVVRSMVLGARIAERRDDRTEADRLQRDAAAFASLIGVRMV